MKKLALGLLLILTAGPVFAADNIPVTVGSGTPIRSTDTSTGATGAGPYVNWYTLSTSGAAGTAPTVLYAPSGSSNTNAISIQGVAAGTAVPVTGGGTSSTFGAAFPGPGTAAGFSDGTNMQAGRVTTYGTAPTGLNALAVNAFVTNTNANGQTTAANSSPVVLASNQSVGDPCTYQAKTNVPISTAAGTTAVVTGVSAKRIYVCSILVITPTAVSVSLSEGSSATCGTSAQAGVIGVATSGTAANGVPLAANGGFSLGAGHATIASTATAANYLCLFQSGTAQLAGNLTYVQQ